MPPIVTFIGWHNCGKTTVAVNVVNYLKKQGYKVAVIKSSSEENVVFDTEGTDTDKHKSAGADSVMFVAPDQMVLQTDKTNLSLQILAHRYFSDVDIVIGEGFKHARQVPKIEILREEEKSLKGAVNGVIAVVTDLDVSGDYVFRSNESKEVGMFIEKRFLGDKKKGRERAVLLVNGQKIPMNSFIQEALAGSVTGLISSLKLKQDVEEIELRIVAE